MKTVRAKFFAQSVEHLVQPNLIPIRYLKLIGDMGVKFEVPGHPPMVATNDEQRRALRRIEPAGLDVPRIERRGGKVKYPQPTEEQARYIVAIWHSPAKPAALVADVQEYMGAEVPPSWVRDRVIKYTGSAARKPDADGKHPFKYEPHGKLLK